MRTLAIIALFIGGTLPALAQNAAHHLLVRAPVDIVIPLTRDYGWWPQGQYRWFPFGPARWGYWCYPASYYRLSCGVGGHE